MFEDSTPAGPLPQDMLSHGGFFLSQFCATSDSPNFISAVAGIGLDTKKGKCDPARLESESGTEAKTEPETQWGATSQSMHVIGEYNSPLQVLAWVSGIGTNARGDVRTPGCSVGVDDTRKVQQLERGPGGPRYKVVSVFVAWTFPRAPTNENTPSRNPMAVTRHRPARRVRA